VSKSATRDDRVIVMPQATTIGLRKVALPEPVLGAVRHELARLASLMVPPRPERLAGLHNPWSNTATLTNAWAFLDLCEHPLMLECVTELIGPDVILWDSQLYRRPADYQSFVAGRREGRYWPVRPLAGAVSIVSLSEPAPVLHADVRKLSHIPLSELDTEAPAYVVRYMPATSRFVRDPQFRANWIAMEEQPLINYTTRPLWLVGGVDRAGNDFVSGFSENAPNWAIR
jgi:hypothetical protein